MVNVPYPTLLLGTPPIRVIVCDWMNAPKKSHLPKIFLVCSTVTWVGPFSRFMGPLSGFSWVQWGD